MTRLGSETPRHATEPLRPLTPETSLGFEVIEFAEVLLHVDLLPWQRWWLIHALELDPSPEADGGFRFKTVLTLVSRQNGKTMLITVLTAWMLFTGRASLALGAAQNLTTAREAWDKVLAYAEGEPELKRLITKVTRGGDTQLVLRGGARYKVVAASRSAGRGLSADLLILDELREHTDWEAWSSLYSTTLARPHSLVVAISNAGEDRAVVLNRLRATALDGKDETLALFEWSAPDGCELDDLDAWAAANPGLGKTIRESVLRSAMTHNTPGAFRTENLCQHVHQIDGAIDLSAWRDCADTTGTMDALREKVYLCLDVSPDLRHVTLVAAAPLGDGRVRVETVDAWDSTSGARAALPDWLDRIRPRAVGWFPGGPAAALAADLGDVKRGAELRAGDVAAVCQGFSEQISARRILHSNDELLNTQTKDTRRLNSGDGWRFTRRGVGHCDAVYAAAGAVHLARTAPKSVGKPRIIVAA